MSAPAGGGLAEVLAVLAKATPGDWQHDRYAPCNEGREDEPDLSLWADMGKGGERFIANIAFDITRPDDCDAICAAVNYLRSHGEAIAELIAADKEHDAAKVAYSEAATGRERNEMWARVQVAEARRARALSNIEGAE